MINRINIIIGSSTIKKFIDLSLSQPFDSHHLLDIHFKAEDVKEILGKEEKSQLSLREITQLWAGEKITAIIMQGEVDASGKFQQKTSKTFIGVITAVQLQMKDAVDNTVIISGVSPTILLNTGTNTRSFSNMSLTDIVDEVAAPLKGFLKANISPEFSESIEYITQYQEDSYHFLQRLAETYGEWFFYDGEQFIFGKYSRKNLLSPSLEYGSNLSQLEYELRLVPMQFKYHQYNYFNDEKYYISSRDENVDLQEDAQAALTKSDNLFSYENLDITFQHNDSKSTLKKSVKFRKSESANKLAVMKGTSTSLEIKVGSPVTVKDDIIENGIPQRTDNYGSFVITNIRHYVDSRGFYQNSFEAIPQDVAYPPVDYRIFRPKAEPQPAKVIDNNDPEMMGRVKVQFDWQNEDQTTPWIRVANPMSGAGTGVYFVPEVDERVFVDFDHGDPDMPFVRGGFFHKNNQPGNKFFQPDNNFKGFITKGGNHILIDDTDGKENIKIYNKESKNELVMSLDGGSHIHIKSNGKIKMDADSIEMNAKNITMKTEDDFKLTSKNTIMESNATIEIFSENSLGIGSTSDFIAISSPTEVRILSKADINLEALNIKAEATAELKAKGLNVEVEGTAQATLKSSAMATVDGGAMTTVKGALVMIN